MSSQMALPTFSAVQKVVFITVVLALIFAPCESESQKLCGSKLTDALKLVCRNKYNMVGKKSGKGRFPHSLRPLLISSASHSHHQRLLRWRCLQLRQLRHHALPQQTLRRSHLTKCQANQARNRQRVLQEAMQPHRVVCVLLHRKLEQHSKWTEN